jgi:hypothetical protein
MSASIAVAPNVGRPSQLSLPRQRTTTVKGTCAMTGLSPTTINTLIRKQKLKSVCIGRRRLVFIDSIEAMLNAAPQAA